MPLSSSETHADIEQTVANWVESIVINLNLCPFAKREVVKHRVRYTVTDATTWNALTDFLHKELIQLIENSSIETTLIIHPKVLEDFCEYNEYIDVANKLVADLNLEGIIQVASFHPDYQFGGTEPGDVENYTNRSPYPILHLLREESLEIAIDNYPDIDSIPQDNIKRVERLGGERMKALLRSCYKK